jgi:hypothetical protein
MKHTHLSLVLCVFAAGCQVSTGGLFAKNPGGGGGSGGGGSGGGAGSGETRSAEVGGPSDATRAWRDAQRQYGEDLKTLHYFATTHPTDGENSADQKADHALGLMKKAGLGEVQKSCAAGTFKGEKDGTSHGEEFMHADTLCPMVEKRDAILKAAVHEWAVAYGNHRLWDMHRSIDTMKEKKRVYLSNAAEGVDAKRERDYLSSFVKKYFEAIGEAVPEELLKKADAHAAEFNQVVESLAAVGTLPKPAAADPGAEAAVRKAYEGGKDNVQVKKVWMTHDDWRVVRNDFGVILRHYKNAEVLVKAKTGNYCLVVPASVGQQHQGGNVYAKEYGVDEFLDGVPVKCP